MHASTLKSAKVRKSGEQGSSGILLLLAKLRIINNLHSGFESLRSLHLLTGPFFLLHHNTRARSCLWLAESNDYDVIVLDLMLPSMDGLTVLQHLRERKNTHVVILTLKTPWGTGSVAYNRGRMITW